MNINENKSDKFRRQYSYAFRSIHNNSNNVLMLMNI